VRWSRIEEPLLGSLPGSRFAGSDEREPIYALAGGGLEHLMLGLLDGAARPEPGRAGRLELARLDGSAPRPGALARLLERRHWRAASATLAIAEELERQNKGPLWVGLASYARAQVPSSPFETDSQQVELDEETLASLREAALAEPPSAFVRATWNWLARVLAGKRDVTAIEAHIAPLAARWAPWPELEIALARADLEALDPAAAVKRLSPLATGPEAPFDVLTVLGEACEQAGDAAGAIQAWKRALEIRPADPWVERRLAMARVRSGDPGGRDAVQRLLEEHPEDEDLRAFLGPGPWPEILRGAGTEPRPH